MVNVDERILAKIDEAEYWLLSHLLKRFNRNGECWPSNKSILSDTGWDIKKLNRVKTSLVEKGLLSITPRIENGRPMSNIYRIETDLMGVYVPAKNTPFIEDTSPKKEVLKTPRKKEGNTPQNGHTEVLSSEVLTSNTNADPSGSAMKGKLYTDAIEAYDPFCKARFHVGAKIDGAQGNAMKKILVYLRANSHEKSDEGVLNAWKYILQNWEKLDDWLKGQVKLTQINSNMLNIINQLKYGHNSRSTGTTAATIDALEALARKLETGG
jgi:hypothetical protein